jgi:hypothetical protein
MAAPVAGFVQLGTEGSGKKMRTRSRTVGADSVHEHGFNVFSTREKLGVYYFGSALLSVQATGQDATTTGFLWLQNPVGSTTLVALREISLLFSNSAATADASSPRILASRFTFTGTASGAAVTAALRKTTDAANVGILRTAVTGMTVTLGATVMPFLVPAVMTAVGSMPSSPQRWPLVSDPFEDGDVILAAAEGVVLYQPDAGSTTDTRRFTAMLRTEEYPA